MDGGNSQNTYMGFPSFSGGENASQNLGLGIGQYIYPEARSFWYNQQDVILDGWKFISCRMDNCRLHVSSSNFIIENCFIDDSTNIIYQGGSIKLIQLFNMRSDWVRGSFPFFAAKKNPDGTFTIGG